MADAKVEPRERWYRARMAGTPKTPLISAMRYEDPAGAIEFLCAAFGFERHLVVPDDEGGVAHAQLRFGNGMIMIGPVRDDDFGRLMVLPDEVGGSTQSVYVIVEDVDAQAARARDAGAEIVIAPHDEDYGGRGFGCRDREGHVRYFGSYDPFSPS